MDTHIYHDAPLAGKCALFGSGMSGNAELEPQSRTRDKHGEVIAAGHILLFGEEYFTVSVQNGRLGLLVDGHFEDLSQYWCDLSDIVGLDQTILIP
jgi:hypothetical protein